MTIILGFLLAAIAPGLSAQTNPAATKQVVQNAVGGTKPAATAPQKPQTAKPASKPAPKAAAATKTAKKPATPTRAGGNEKPAEGAEAVKAARRDPFESLVSRQQADARNRANLPPGKAGLQVSSLRVDGIVKASNGMIAVVTNRKPAPISCAKAIVCMTERWRRFLWMASLSMKKVRMRSATCRTPSK